MQDTYTSLKNGNVDEYDLFIVYTPGKAKSANNKKYRRTVPFSKKSDGHNKTYGYFLMKCKELGIKAAFTISKDIIGPGLVRSFWTYDKKWKRNLHKAYSQVIFDKFRHNGKEKVFFSKSVYAFNRKIRKFFCDKLKTYTFFKEFSIPTISIMNISREGLMQAKEKLDRLTERNKNVNGSADGYIIKDRFGGEGHGIFRTDLESGIEPLLMQLKKFAKKIRPVSYILQPFMNCDKGFTIDGYSGFIDLKIIILDCKIIDTYIRIASKGDFRNDGVNGGRLVFIPKESIPEDVIRMANKIRGIIDEEGNNDHFYSLDFIKNNEGNIFLVEGNSKPGIIWAFGENSPDMTEMDKMINKEKNMHQINLIVKVFKSIIDKKKQSVAI